MKTIRARLVVLVATAAIAPLVAYGLVSIGLLWSETARAVSARFRVPLTTDRDIIYTLPQWTLASPPDAPAVTSSSAPAPAPAPAPSSP